MSKSNKLLLVVALGALAWFYLNRKPAAPLAPRSDAETDQIIADAEKTAVTANRATTDAKTIATGNTGGTSSSNVTNGGASSMNTTPTMDSSTPTFVAIPNRSGFGV